MQDILKEPINLRVMALLAIFLIGSFIIASSNHILFDTSQNYQNLIENQDERYQLGMIIIEKLDSIEKNFLKFALIEDAKEINTYKEPISSDISSIKQILNVIQNGGEYEDILQANFDNVNEIIVVHKYTKSSDEGIIIEVIDLTPKLIEIELLYDDLVQNVQLKLESLDETEILKAKEEIAMLLKQADTYFQRSHENAAEIFYNSQQKILQLEEERTQTVTLYQIANYLIIITFVSVAIIISIKIVLQIGKIINERRKAEVTVKKTLETTESILEGLPIGVVVVGKDKKIRRVNNAALAIMGKTKDDIVGKICHSSMCPAQVGKCPIWDLGGKVDNSERIVIGFNGKKIPVLKTALPISLMNEDVLLETFIDITERKKVEEQLRIKSKELEKSKGQLEDKVEERTKEINEKVVKLKQSEAATFNMMQDLEQTMKELEKTKDEIEKQNLKLKKLNSIKSVFLNVTSHELRTPLAGIKGYVQMMLSQVFGKINDEQKDALDLILQNTDHLNHIVQDILDSSQIQAGTMKFIIKETDVEKMANDAVNIMRSSAKLKDIKITSNVEQNIPSLFIDKDRIKQVITNLIGNAIKFSSEKTVIDVRVKKEKNSVKFEVQDQGRGIPKDKQKNIFEMFYQVDQGLDRQAGGVGLGLSISMAIISAHGGKLDVESPGQDKGSTFIFTLPIESVKDVEKRFKDIDLFGTEK